MHISQRNINFNVKIKVIFDAVYSRECHMIHCFFFLLPLLVYSTVEQTHGPAAYIYQHYWNACLTRVRGSLLSKLLI